MAVIAILGAGMMGSALTVPLVDRGHEVRLVGTHLDGEIIDELCRNGKHLSLGLELPAGVRPYRIEDLDAAMRDIDILALGVSSKGMRWAARTVGPRVTPGLPILMVTKGLEWDGAHLLVFPDLFRALLPESVRASIAPVGITGPCIAGELARRVPTCVTFSGRDEGVALRLAEETRGGYYHVFPSPDVAGHEACAALKNAYAMGIAFAQGLHERAGGSADSIALHNYESAVFAQAVEEMRLVVRLVGGDPATAAGLSGVGDLDVTTNGGRTGRFGRLLGLGLSVEESIERMEGATLECLDVLRVLRTALPSLERRGELGPNDLPLLRHLAEVVLDGAPVNVPFARFFGG